MKLQTKKPTKVGRVMFTAGFDTEPKWITSAVGGTENVCWIHIGPAKRDGKTIFLFTVYPISFAIGII